MSNIIHFYFDIKNIVNIHFPNHCLNEILPEDAKRRADCGNVWHQRLTTASFLKSERPVIMKTRQWHLEAESNLIYLTSKNKSLFFWEEIKTHFLWEKKRDHFNCIAKINQAESKLDLTTKKHRPTKQGEKNKGKKDAKQQILFFKKEKERERKRNPKTSFHYRSLIKKKERGQANE